MAFFSLPLLNLDHEYQNVRTYVRYCYKVYLPHQIARKGEGRDKSQYLLIFLFLFFTFFLWNFRRIDKYD
jgi:hypothetical protein